MNTNISFSNGNNIRSSSNLDDLLKIIRKKKRENKDSAQCSLVKAGIHIEKKNTKTHF